MSDKHLTEQETKALVERLQQLPDAIDAPDRWQQIQAKLEQQPTTQTELPAQSAEQPVVTHRKFWQPMAAAAVLVLAVTFYTISPWKSQDVENGTLAQTQTINSQPDLTSFKLTVASLELASSQYYAKLGYQLEQSQAGLDPSIRQSLKDLRNAQQQYTAALEQQPNDLQLQQQLIEMYQKERQLLQKIIV
ncbi:hypothetical protein [Kangiella aquimarina]|uniref:Anti-sigma factor n=1 Tax=Kangiella aquimarina TaxID=261965 RepID=A0ABZ0X3L8_9GAMM|nr:hypothetical protein [Kangiella aquimarina]WQG85114.1 hypothetical protein SR900_11650 [Kangiella aquimarina]